MNDPEEEYVHCPNCPDQGWYGVERVVTRYHYDMDTDDLEPYYDVGGEQVQCEFCWTIENSYFNKWLKENPSGT
jgi:predicted RNA-binding protein with PUA-like domain